MLRVLISIHALICFFAGGIMTFDGGHALWRSVVFGRELQGLAALASSVPLALGLLLIAAGALQSGLVVVLDDLREREIARRREARPPAQGRTRPGRPERVDPTL